MVSILRSASCPTAKAVSNSSAQWALRQLAPAQPTVARHISQTPRSKINPTLTPARNSIRGIVQPSGPWSHTQAEGSFRSSAARSSSVQARTGFRSLGSVGATSNPEKVSTPSLSSSFSGLPLRGPWTLVGFLRVKNAGGRCKRRGFSVNAAGREFVIKGEEFCVPAQLNLAKALRQRTVFCKMWNPLLLTTK